MHKFIIKNIGQIFLLFFTLSSIYFLLSYFNDLNFYTNSTHVFQSLSYLKGNLHLPSDPSTSIGDLHYYNGAWYSAWGFGIPILQMPFHFFSIMLTDKPFPDLIIFIFFTLLTTSIIYKSLCKRLGVFLSIPVAYLVMALSLSWLLSYRFLIYEESCAYFILFTINSFVYFIESIENNNKKYIPYLVLNLFISIMIRPTGIITAFLILLYYIIKKRDLLKRYIFLFILPTLFYCYLNFLKAGTIIPSGLATSHPGVVFEMFFIRTASPCNFGTDLTIYLERLVYIFKAFFLNDEIFGLFHNPNMNEAISQNCVTMLEDSKGQQKPWFNIFFFKIILIGIFILLAKKKFFETFFIIFGFVTILCLYTFLTNGAAYRYSVDFYFYIIFIIYLIYNTEILSNRFFNGRIYENLIFSFEDIIKVSITVSLLYFSYPSILYMVKTNGGITTFDSGINISELNWNYSSSHPSIRRCNDVNVSGFNIYDKMGWQSDCRVNSFLNIYLSKPNNKKWFMIDIQGKNIPKKLFVRINGKVYKNFNIYNDKIYIRSMVTNNYNLFIYDTNHNKDFYIEEIKLK